jgi:hypothetical protein
MITKNFARRMAASIGVLSLSTLGMAAVAGSASASPNPAACKASNMSVTFQGVAGTVSNYNPNHPSFPDVKTYYRLLVKNKGTAACTLAKADPIVQVFTPADVVATSVGSPIKIVMPAGDVDQFYYGVNSPSNYDHLACNVVGDEHHHHHFDGEEHTWSGHDGHGQVTVCGFVAGVVSYQTVHLDVNLPGVSGPPLEVFTGWNHAITVPEVAGGTTAGPIS